MTLSVIIPAYNEETTIKKTLIDLYENHEPQEVIVVDGGSSDKTVSLVRELDYPNLKLIQSGKGRAVQMNQGVLQARGDALLFLHADTHLPQRGLELIQESFSKGLHAGRFRMQFDDSRVSLRLFQPYTHLQCFSYGDQGIFVTRELFDEIGGYAAKVPFEDVAFYRQLRRKTSPIILPAKVTTSARRFLKNGTWRQKWINLFLVGLIAFGFDISTQKEKLYPDIR